MPRLDFIDVSHWNGTINWEQVASQGILGVIMKATEGTSYVDDKYYSYRMDAQRAGLPVATYHFLKHGSVVAQMEHYIAAIEPLFGERVVIDYEDENCTADDLLEAVDYLLSDDHKLQVTVYGAMKLTDDVEALGDDTGRLGHTSLWAARYNPDEPPLIAKNVWSYWTAWQYTDEGVLTGIDEAVDLNQFNGSAEDCVKWFGPASTPPKPEPIRKPEVVVDITADLGVKVTVLVNGEQPVPDIGGELDG